MYNQAPVESIAEAYLELLSARGIEYFFGNGGTDFAPIIEAYAKRQVQELPAPRPIPVPHEVTAVSMAHGYTMITGRPQVVMVHTVPGTANAIGGIVNAFRSNIPMLFSAGRTPITEGDARGSRDGSIHWAQESFDQAAMVREWVKWDYELRHGADLEGVVDRALAIAESPPAGPVYLTLPREVLAEEIQGLAYRDVSRQQKAGDGMPVQELINRAAGALARARNPVLVTRGGGKDPRAVAPLVELAELLGMAVFEAGALYANFPKDHALYAGSDVGSALAGADAVVVLEADVPWTPKRHQPAEGAVVIGVGEDPLFSAYPVRGFQVDLNLAGNPRLVLQALVDAVRGIGVDAGASRERADSWQRRNDEMREGWRRQATAGSGDAPISKSWFTRCLSDVLDEDTVVLNELGIDAVQIDVKRPGSFFGVPVSGGLGWGVGAALGAKLADGSKTVICCVGDGSYIFGSGTAGHIVSTAQGLPILTIVWNNGIWNAVQSATRNTYADGFAVQNNNFAVTTLSQSFQYELICQAAGGYGERVEDPSEVPAALERALNVVRHEKRQALLNVIGQ
jgi:acetolactate synthase-1/2/3 large subunit